MQGTVIRLAGWSACFSVLLISTLGYAQPEANSGAAIRRTHSTSTLDKLIDRLIFEIKSGPRYVDFGGESADNTIVKNGWRFCSVSDATGSLAGSFALSAGIYLYRGLAIQAELSRMCRGATIDLTNPSSADGTVELRYDELLLAVKYDVPVASWLLLTPSVSLSRGWLQSAFNETGMSRPNVAGDYKDTIHSVSWGAAVALRIRSRLYVTAGFRYQYGLGEIDTFDDEELTTRSVSGLVGLRWGGPSKSRVQDLDGDGFADSGDLCPRRSGKDEFEGCPDKDNDGFPEHYPAVANAVVTIDRCENEPGPIDGCPDQDGDLVADIDDECPEPGTVAGCPDSDGDRVADKDDSCPNEAGDANNPDGKGCPRDTDGDGIRDTEDRCPRETVADKSLVVRKAGSEYYGCLDTDGDRIPDKADQCDKKAETRNSYEDGDGCPAELLPSAIAKAFGGRRKPSRARLEIKASVDDQKFEKTGTFELEKPDKSLTNIIEALDACPKLRIEVQSSSYKHRGTVDNKARAEAVKAHLAKGRDLAFQERISAVARRDQIKKRHVRIQIDQLVEGEQPESCKSGN